MPRIRRPLLALVVLVAALGIGYGVRAVDHHTQHHPATPTTSSTH